MNDITTFEIIDAMREAGGWYLRKRKRAKPALWCTSERTAVAPAVPADVVHFMCATFQDCAGIDYRSAKLIGEAVIAELRYHDHRLPVIDDATVGLIT